jgi:hypothetical protein
VLWIVIVLLGALVIPVLPLVLGLGIPLSLVLEELSSCIP